MFFADYIFVYLVRVLIRTIRMFGSKSWPVVTATVDGVSVDKVVYKSVELLYVYDVDGDTFTGRSTKPFLSSSSAEEYAARFCEGSSLKVRIKPEAHDISVVRGNDQATQPGDSF